MPGTQPSPVDSSNSQPYSQVTLELGDVQLRENSPWLAAKSTNTFLHFSCREKS